MRDNCKMIKQRFENLKNKIKPCINRRKHEKRLGTKVLNDFGYKRLSKCIKPFHINWKKICAQKRKP